ncbi:hypothetical protein ACVU7I_01775 [Patulibacter sp. S7RM1-6]
MPDERKIQEVVFEDETAGHKVSEGHRPPKKTIVSAVPPPKPLKKSTPRKAN